MRCKIEHDYKDVLSASRVKDEFVSCVNYKDNGIGNSDEICVTTSYYSEQAQGEIFQAGCLVKFFSGDDLIEILHEQRLITNRLIKSNWLNSILSDLIL